jgi:plastocyanin
MVYVEKGPVPPGDFSKGHFVMDQKDLTFLPHILVIPVGSTVDFPNHDKVNHNVFSLSDTKKFNLGSYGPGVSKSVVFDKPGIVELRCDIHAEMIAYIMVLKTPYAAVTDARGQFRIPDLQWAESAGLPALPELPAGTYTVKIWQEKLRPVKEEITVPAHGAASAEIKAQRGPAGSVLYK